MFYSKRREGLTKPFTHFWYTYFYIKNLFALLQLVKTPYPGAQILQVQLQHVGNVYCLSLGNGQLLEIVCSHSSSPPLRPALMSSPPLCPPHWSIRYNSTISSSTKNFCFCQSTYYILLHSSVFILIYSTNIYQMFYCTQACHSMQGEYRNDKRQRSSHLLRSLCSSVFIILQWAVNSSLERALSADLSSLLLLLSSSQFKPLWLYLSLLENSILVTYPEILLLIHRYLITDQPLTSLFQYCHFPIQKTE